MKETETLIRESQTGNQEALTELLEDNTGLIWSIARRFAGRGTELADLYQLGCVGFLKAVQGFQFEYGTQFSTYAVPKICGEIRRFLRDDGAIKISRTLKEEAFLIYTVQNELMKELGREPTLQEISEKTKLSIEEIAEVHAANSAVESIQSPNGENGFTLENVLTDSHTEDEMLERLSLNEAINKLNERNQMVIRLRYFHGLTQDQIARILQISQVQVSRIEKKALEQLRSLMR